MTVPCPSCNRRTAVKHCPSPTCKWARCTYPPCQAVLDPARGIGFRNSTSGDPVQTPGRKATTHMPINRTKET